jgi:hypothetical protein
VGRAQKQAGQINRSNDQTNQDNNEETTA